MKNSKKKNILKYSLICAGIGALIFAINKNRKQAGIIRNQKDTIEGLLKQIKNLSYHLGKKSTF